MEGEEELMGVRRDCRLGMKGESEVRKEVREMGG